MHRPLVRPACWATEATVRAPWAIGEGRACGTYRHDDHDMNITPTCSGCARLELARLERALA
jgi:hypothetical protein